MFAVTWGMLTKPNATRYTMVIIGGKARMSRPSNVLYPLPSVRCDRKAHAHVNVREPSATAILPREWKPGLIIARPMRSLVFP